VPADTTPPAELARFIDLHGKRVTAVTAGLRSEQVAILTATADKGLEGGHPFLSQDNARELGYALIAFADREPQS
jgi:hypothetical protein